MHTREMHARTHTAVHVCTQAHKHPHTYTHTPTHTPTPPHTHPHPHTHSSSLEENTSDSSPCIRQQVGWSLLLFHLTTTWHHWTRKTNKARRLQDNEHCRPVGKAEHPLLHCRNLKIAIFRNSLFPRDNRGLEQPRRQHSRRWDSWDIYICSPLQSKRNQFLFLSCSPHFSVDVCTRTRHCQHDQKNTHTDTPTFKIYFFNQQTTLNAICLSLFLTFIVKTYLMILFPTLNVLFPFPFLLVSSPMLIISQTGRHSDPRLFLFPAGTCRN